MTNDPAVFGYLGRALSLELSAVQQYLSLARLLEIRCMPEAGAKFRAEGKEEMEHAERIISRMLAVGVAPSASCLRPAQVNGSLAQIIQHTVELEREIVDFYGQAVRHCYSTQDHENRIFFEALLKEEQEHATGLVTWWQQLIGQPVAGPKK